MLPARNRLHHAAEFRAVMRYGARKGTSTVVVHVLAHPPSLDRLSGPRLGLVVSKAVGNSVQRHHESRRLRHIFRAFLNSNELEDCAVVIRALPAITTAQHGDLEHDVHSCLRRAVSSARKRRDAALGGNAAMSASTGNDGAH